MLTFKKPDLSAPRFRAKRTNLLNKQMYDAFIEKYPKYKELGLSEFKKIVSTYNGLIQTAVIDNRDGVKLPESLGYLLIAKCDKPKKANTDFAASAKYGKKVNHANWDSDNYLAKICYSNYSLKYRFSDRELWGFSPVKQFRSAVAGSFPSKYNNYIHLTENIKLSELFKNV
jgi:hypothetical protein